MSALAQVLRDPDVPRHAALEACPICGERGERLPGKLSTYVRAFDAVVSQTYAHCSSCDFAYADRPFDETTLRAYYGDNDQLRRETLTVEEARHILAQVTFLADAGIGAGDAVLEVGADTGSFLVAAAQQLGVRGLFDEWNARACEVLERRGLADARTHDGPYRAIVLRHVLEHIVDPVQALAGLRSQLCDDGVVMLEVPDCTAIALGESDPFQLEHVNYFSLTSIARAASRAGFYVSAQQSTRTPGYSTTPNRVLRLALRKCVGVQDRSAWTHLMDSTLRHVRAIDRFMDAHPGQRFAMYGAGTLTLEYFANTSRASAPVRLYDRDPRKRAAPLLGHVVHDPETLEADDFDHLFIMVVGYEREVRAFLRDKGVPDRKIVGRDVEST